LGDLLVLLLEQKLQGSQGLGLHLGNWGLLESLCDDLLSLEKGLLLGLELVTCY